MFVYSLGMLALSAGVCAAGAIVFAAFFFGTLFLAHKLSRFIRNLRGQTDGFRMVIDEDTERPITAEYGPDGDIVSYRDAHGNVSTVEYFSTPALALSMLKTLKDCVNCINCSQSTRCVGCKICIGVQVLRIANTPHRVTVVRGVMPVTNVKNVCAVECAASALTP